MIDISFRCTVQYLYVLPNDLSTFLVMRAFKIYALSGFLIYNTVLLLTVVTILYVASLGLILVCCFVLSGDLAWSGVRYIAFPCELEPTGRGLAYLIHSTWAEKGEERDVGVCSCETWR